MYTCNIYVCSILYVFKLRDDSSLFSDAYLSFVQYVFFNNITNYRW